MSDTVNPAATQDLDAKIVEIMARAECRYLTGNEDRWDIDLDAQRFMLRAIHEAGFEVVPREPTEAMIQAGDDICPIARGTETHKIAGGVVPEDYWRVMVEAARR